MVKQIKKRLRSLSKDDILTFLYTVVLVYAAIVGMSYIGVSPLLSGACCFVAACVWACVQSWRRFRKGYLRSSQQMSDVLAELSQDIKKTKQSLEQSKATREMGPVPLSLVPGLYQQCMYIIDDPEANVTHDGSAVLTHVLSSLKKRGTPVRILKAPATTLRLSQRLVQKIEIGDYEFPPGLVSHN